MQPSMAGKLRTKPMRERVQKVYREYDWTGLAELAEWVVAQALAIQQIPAPTFHEKQRAAHVARLFRQLGLQDVATDELMNVCGRLPGASSTLPGVMVCAHLDTVFPVETDLSTRRENELIYGPGLGDNSIGVAALLGLARTLGQTGTRPERDLWLVATSCEEGLGDLKGMRAVFERLQQHTALVINLEGLALGHIYHAGIAVQRLHITARGPGGHSWAHFGRPSAIHHLMKLGARLTEIELPASPRTTYNIGMIEGGHAINVIAAEAALWLDMRSEGLGALDALRRQVYENISALQTDELQFAIEVVGDRPSGSIPASHPLVAGAQAALECISESALLASGSTDGNIPLAQGCPTVTIGVTRGGNAHRLDEYIETRFVAPGLQQIITLVLAAAIHEGKAEVQTV